MKPNIHPEYRDGHHHLRVRVGRPDPLHARLVRRRHLRECHPFYTGKQSIVDTAGRVERFRRKYGTKST